MVAPKQAWEKVTFAFKFCPFKTKMVKGTSSFVIKPLDWNKHGQKSHLCPRRLQPKGELQKKTLGWEWGELGTFLTSVPWRTALHCSLVLLVTVGLFFLTEHLKMQEAC